MPTKSYRFYDPIHQASFQQVLQSSDCTVHYQKGHATSPPPPPWSRSSARRDFEDAQQGQDMSHIVPHNNWIQHNLTNAVPSTSSTSVTAETTASRPINLYIRSPCGTSWAHCGAALLTLHHPNANANVSDRRWNQAWVTLHSHGSGRIAGSFSVFYGMQIIRFNESVLCTTIQTTPDSPTPRFVTYGFQSETIDQANGLRDALAFAARAAVPSSGMTSGTPTASGHDVDGRGAGAGVSILSPDAMERSMERRLSSWIHGVEEHLAHAPIQPTSVFDVASASGIAGHTVGTGTGSNRRIQRRGGIDLGGAYWDLEKARALKEAKTELDSLQLKRLLSGFQLG